MRAAVARRAAGARISARPGAARVTAWGRLAAPGTALAFGVITAAAIVLRFARLPGVGLYPDEASEGVDALRLLHEPGFHPLFFADDGGREVTFGYMVAAAFRVAGTSVTVLRGVAAAVGVAGVMAVYLMLRRFGRGVALAGMAWAAGSTWLVVVSRDGMRNTLTLAAGALAIAALIAWEALPGLRRRALVAGAAVGLGLWVYQPLKLLPLLVIAWMLVLRRVRPDVLAAMLPRLRWLLGGFMLMALPIAAAAILDPVGYFGRAVGVTAGSTPSGPAGIAGHALRTVGLLCCTGDANPRHDVDALPALAPVLTAIALLGAYRCWRRRREGGHLLFLLGVPIFLLPPLISFEGSTPHLLRSLGLAPVLAGLVGLGCAEVAGLAAGRVGARAAAPVWAAVGVGLTALAVGSARAYFGRPDSALFFPYSQNVVQLAAAAARPGSTVVIDDFSGTVVRFLDWGSPPRLVAPGTRVVLGPGERVVALTRNDLRAAVGAAAARAHAIAQDPTGRPTVFEVVAGDGAPAA